MRDNAFTQSFGPGERDHPDDELPAVRPDPAPPSRPGNPALGLRFRCRLCGTRLSHRSDQLAGTCGECHDTIEGAA